MTQDGESIEDGVRQRIRALRTERGWSLDELAARSHLSSSTLSRLETGGRRLALDHVVVLARALEVDVSLLLGTADEPDDVIIRPQRSDDHGDTTWLLTRAGDPSGKVVAKMRMPARRGHLEAKVHPGRDWFLVLSGTARLLLGEREHLVREGEAAEFSTLTPHAIAGYGGPVEILTIFDRHGAASHLPGRPAGR
jgi:transcriptional regulator with XRE-family HTH domain